MEVDVVTRLEPVESEAMILGDACSELKVTEHGETCPRDVASCHCHNAERQVQVRRSFVVVIGDAHTQEPVDIRGKRGVHLEVTGRATRQA